MFTRYSSLHFTTNHRMFSVFLSFTFRAPILKAFHTPDCHRPSDPNLIIGPPPTQAICLLLGHGDLASCRLVCRSWRVSFGQTLQSFTIRHLTTPAAHERAAEELSKALKEHSTISRLNVVFSLADESTQWERSGVRSCLSDACEPFMFVTWEEHIQTISAGVR